MSMQIGLEVNNTRIKHMVREAVNTEIIKKVLERL